MRKIWVFTNVSLDGYFEDLNHDISWANSEEYPFEAFSADQGTDTLLLGHTTYAQMESFWPTPQAAASAPDVAKFMNEKLKVVVSHTPFEPNWQNVMVVSDDVAGAVQKLKEQPGGEIAMFGSNTLVVSLMQHGLIDEFRILVNPVALGGGVSLFADLPEKTKLTLIESHQYPSGRVLLTYKPTTR